MSGAPITDLYRQLALHHVEQAIDTLALAPAELIVAHAALALERAAGALACMTALYTADGTAIRQRWQDQIGELVAIAATLEQLADLTHQPPVNNNRNHQ